jgi:hypothetical protein
MVRGRRGTPTTGSTILLQYHVQGRRRTPTTSRTILLSSYAYDFEDAEVRLRPAARLCLDLIEITMIMLFLIMRQWPRACPSLQELPNQTWNSTNVGRSEGRRDRLVLSDHDHGQCLAGEIVLSWILYEDRCDTPRDCRFHNSGLSVSPCAALRMHDRKRSIRAVTAGFQRCSMKLSICTPWRNRFVSCFFLMK